MANQAVVDAKFKTTAVHVNNTFLNNHFDMPWLPQQNSFNNLPAPNDEDKIIAQLFEECVEIYGDQIAVRSSSGAISYSELNAKANQLANYLRKCGVGKNSLVAIYLERSLELIIATLAVVKAGGIFLPLSTDDPSNRIRRILQDSNPVKTLTSSTLQVALMGALSTNSETNIICINRFFDAKIELDDSNPIYINTPEDPLYVMYTSGSTGKPKGCVIPHHGVTRVVTNTNYIKIDASDNIAQIANAAFDAMTFEMWGALFHGACLHIIPQIVLLSPMDFAQALKQNNISILFLTASLLNLMVKSCPDAFDKVKYLLFGGEKANPEIVKELLTRKLKYGLTHLNIINAYGPTECTTFAATFSVQNMADIQKNVPIGKPITNTTAYILDENLQFVPPGVLGELYLGGKGVALGYLNDPKQTAYKFINNPWNDGEKIYRTGDLVYWLPDVGIVYVDRVDAQVKINGFRVEPTEIEATIVKNRAVKQAVVVVQTDRNGEKKLVAYICFYNKDTVDFAKFHQYLKDNIPYYMMPCKTIQVDFIPLTINGKTDTTSLEQMHGKNILEADTHDVPANNAEEVLIEVWQQLLNISYINVTQNIFDLGAHSLMLSEACTLMNTKLKTNVDNAISIMDILNYPTIQQLSDYINKREVNKAHFLEEPIARATQQRQVLMARKSLHAIQ